MTIGLSRWLVFALLLLLTASARGDEEDILMASDRAEFVAVSALINRAKTMTLYEGLPHQRWEPKSLERELKTKKTVKIHGFPFYARALALQKADLESLRRLSASPAHFTTFMENKLCGGYHPDYCMAWTDAEVTYHLMICLGCGEMIVRGPKVDLHLDISFPVLKQFKAILSKYRGQRPKLKLE